MAQAILGDSFPPEKRGLAFALYGITVICVAIDALAIRLMHAGLSMHTAQQQALGRLYALVQAQAAVLSYVDVYWLLAVASMMMFLGSFLLKRYEPGKGGNASVHKNLNEMRRRDIPCGYVRKLLPRDTGKRMSESTIDSAAGAGLGLCGHAIVLAVA
jgi:hypothetical protein